MQDRLIFLIAPPRSGSTLLMRMLSSHSAIYSRAEPHLLTQNAARKTGQPGDLAATTRQDDLLRRQLVKPGGNQRRSAMKSAVF